MAGALLHRLGAGGGGSAPPASSEWTLDTNHDFAASPTAQLDVVLSEAWDELLIIMDAVTAGGSVENRSAFVSTDGGSTFFTSSGDYSTITHDAFLDARGEMWFTANTSAAQYNFCHIPDTTGYNKMLFNAEDYPAANFGAFKGDLVNRINALRFTASSGQNLSGGNLYIYGRIAPWAQIGSWIGGTDPSAANLDFTGLSGYDELIMNMVGVGASASANRSIRYSVNNGSSFYATVGDYRREILTNGTITTWEEAQITGNDSTAAKWMHHRLLTAAMAMKAGISIGGREAGLKPGSLFTASSSPVDALRLTTRTATLLNSGNVRVSGRELPWTLVEARNCASAAAVNQDFTDLSTYNELLIVMDGVGASGSTNRVMRLSTDNGATFSTTVGDYFYRYSAGAKADGNAAFYTNGDSASARYGILHIPSTKAIVKPFVCAGGDARYGTFRSGSDIDAIRVCSNNANTLNSGMLYVYGR